MAIAIKYILPVVVPEAQCDLITDLTNHKYNLRPLANWVRHRYNAPGP